MRVLKKFLIYALCLSLISLPAPAEEVEGAAKEIVVTFLGDCTLGSEEHTRAQETSFDSYVLKNGWEYPFSGVQEVIANDDLTVANLEGVFYDRQTNRADKQYTFRAPMEFAKVLSAGSVEAVSIANNHIGDYGQTGVRDTLIALENENIAWMGSTQYARNVYIYEQDDIKIGFISMFLTYRWRDPDGVKEDIQKLHDAGCDVICAVMHGGVEYDQYRGEDQEKLAKYYIRNGADIVVGHHPHVLQGCEVQDGVTVLYSIGNFVFGGNKNMRAYQTVMAQFTFSFDENGEYLGHQLNLIPCQYSGSREYNDYRPIMVYGEEAQAVIDSIQKDSSVKLNPYVEGVGAIQDFVPASAKENAAQ